MENDQELARRLGVSVEQVEEIRAAAKIRHDNELAHRLHDDAEAEDARARMRHR